jgi:hypothetical protein
VATTCSFDGLPQQLKGAGIVRSIRRVHSADAEDCRQLFVGLGVCLGFAERRFSGLAPAGLYLDETELPEGRDGSGTVTGLPGKVDRFVQQNRTLLVSPACGVDQRSAQRCESFPLQLPVRTAVCFGYGPAEALQSGLYRSGGNRGATRFELAKSSGSSAERRDHG